MTWKSYALVSGAGLLATYLASSPTPLAPENRQPTRPAAAARAAAIDGTDIQEQAARLQARNGGNAVYRLPARNPFQFVMKPAPPPVAVAAPPREEPVDLMAAARAIRRASIKLSGIAVEGEGDTMQRTAIVSTPQGVAIVRAGESIESGFRVIAVGEDSVELEDSTDQSRVTLQLAR